MRDGTLLGSRGLMTVGRVHLMLGLAGSGTSTLARRLCEDAGAVRFTLDEWMLRLNPGVDFESSEYGRLAADARTRAGEGFFHAVTRAGNEHLSTLMQTPDPGEGIDVVVP